MFLLLTLSSLNVSVGSENIDEDFISHSVGSEIWDENSLISHSVGLKGWNDANPATASTIIGGLGRVWEEVYEESSGESIIFQQGYIYVFGEDSGAYDREVILTKWFPNGTLVWEKSLSEEFCYGIRSAWGDGENLYLTGQEYTTYDKYLAKINSDGDVVYVSKSDCFGGSIWGNEESLYVSGWHNLSKINSSDGSIVENYDLPEEAPYKAYYFWGNEESLYTIGDDCDGEAYLTKWHLNGTIFWTAYIGTSFPYGTLKGCLWGNEESIYALLECSLDDALLLSKFSTEGDLIWNVTNDNIIPTSLIGDENGLYIVGATDYWKSELLIARYDLEGNFLWEKSWRTKDYGDQKLYDIAFGENNTAIYTLGSESEMVLTKWVYDVIPPTLNDISNVHYEQSDSIFNLRWFPHDENPTSYTIFKNSYEIESGNWTSGEVIEVEIDRSSALGQYNYTIVVGDLSGNTAIGVCIVTIEDTTSPTLSSSYSNDTKIIVWVAEDRNPGSYFILKDNNQISSGSWISGAKISTTVIPEKKNSLNYTIIVLDTSGNVVSSSVIIPSVGSSGDDDDSSSDTFLGFWPIILIIIGTAGVVLVAILIKDYLDDSRDKSPSL